MIKKFIGVLATLAVLALVVFTAIDFGTYKSMLPEDLFTASADAEVAEAVEVAPADEFVVEAEDSCAVDGPIVADSAEEEVVEE